jgi:hypothetical protein
MLQYPQSFVKLRVLRGCPALFRHKDTNVHDPLYAPAGIFTIFF